MSDDTYRRWARGDCPCCGAALDWWPDVAPEAIGEGVMICGRCVENDHMRLDGEDVLTAAMLEAIVTRSDDPVDRVLASVQPAPYHLPGYTP